MNSTKYPTPSPASQVDCPRFASKAANKNDDKKGDRHWNMVGQRKNFPILTSLPYRNRRMHLHEGFSSHNVLLTQMTLLVPNALRKKYHPATKLLLDLVNRPLLVCRRTACCSDTISRRSCERKVWCLRIEWLPKLTATSQRKTTKDSAPVEI